MLYYFRVCFVIRYYFVCFFRFIYFFRARTQYALPGALLLYFQCVCVLFCSAHNRWLTYSAFVVLHNDSQPGFAALWMLSDVYDSYAAYVVLVILFEFIQTKKKLYKSLFRRFFFNDITANLLLFFVCLWFYTTLILYVVVIRCSTFAILACGCSLLILGRFVRVFRYYEFILRGWLLQQKKREWKMEFLLWKCWEFKHQMDAGWNT